MKVRFYQFAKRNKSTATPTGNYHEVDCQLKDATSITTPTLLLQTFSAYAYNYVYIPDWERYYFIMDSQSVENMWEVQLQEDVLASFKTEIGSTSCNIMYATGSTKDIADTRIPVQADILRGHEYTAITDLTITDGQGAIILGITGKGSFGSYLLKNSADIPDLLDGIDTWWTTTVQSTMDSIKQCFFGGAAAECLKSAIALPLVIGGSDVGSGTAEDIYLGNYPCLQPDGTTPIQGYRITKPIIHKTTTVNIPWQSSDWKRISGYTTISLYMPLIGILNLPATELRNDSSIEVHLSINITSGDISCEVFGSTSNIKVATASGNCAMNTAYGNTGIDTTRATQAIIAGVGTAAAALLTGGAGAIAGAAIGNGLASTASNAMQAIGGTGFGSGGLGGGSSQGLDKVIHIFVSQKQLTDTQSNFNNIIGKPYMGVSTPASFQGYVQSDGFQFASNRAYSSEKDSINSMLDSGIYYE